MLQRLRFDKYSALYLWALFMIVFTITEGTTFLSWTSAELVFTDPAVFTGTLALAFLVPLATGTYDLSIGANGVGLGRERSFLPERPKRIVKRNSQTVLNVAFNGLTSGGDVSATAAPMFWDLRVRTRSPGRGRSTERQPGLPPHVCSRVRRKRTRQRHQPRAGAGGLSAHARRLQHAVRSLHAW